MRAVIGGLAVPAFILFVCAGAVATTVATSTYDDGIHKTYTYTLTSEEDGDYVTVFHLFAPVHISLVSGWCDNTAWSFDRFFDTEINALDIYWQVDTSNSRGLASGDSQEFKLRTNSSVQTINNFVACDGDFGNWGIESEWYAGYGYTVMMPCVPVPNQMPEPSTMLALLSAFVAYAVQRRRR